MRLILTVQSIFIERSSAELSEAINSMFRWYQEASVCVVFLADVPSSRFDESSWFTRGWTLQELLAPDKVLFYDNNWHAFGYIGRSIPSLVRSQPVGRDLADEVSIITGVPSEDLELFQPKKSRTCIAQRMSWAARRTTTRLEDEAYSLLGVFDINMLLLYGEGCRAFARLQEEIIKRSTDDSIFAWTAERKAMASRNTRYMGILTPSPNNFKNGSNIRPPRGMTREERKRPGWQISNRGLELYVCLEKVSDPAQMTRSVEGIEGSLGRCRFLRLSYHDEELTYEEPEAVLSDPETNHRIWMTDGNRNLKTVFGLSIFPK